jgi:hypothetical protein
MARKPPKEPKINSWDRRPWPVSGDSDPRITFAAVGEALSQWEHLEGIIALTFAAFVSADEDNLPATRSYVAVRTFEGRADMLKAASEAFFSDFPDEELLDGYKTFLANIKSFSTRRNEITHGVVDDFYRKISDDNFILVPGAFALYPTVASFKERTLEGRPSDCMTSNEITYYSTRFRGLLRPAIGLVRDVNMKRLSRRASRIARELDHE